MEPLLIIGCGTFGLLLFFGIGLTVGYAIAQRGFRNRLVILNTPDDYREQGARLVNEAYRTNKVDAGMEMRKRAFEHFRMADIIENTGSMPVVPKSEEKS